MTISRTLLWTIGLATFAVSALVAAPARAATITIDDSHTLLGDTMFRISWSGFNADFIPVCSAVGGSSTGNQTTGSLDCYETLTGVSFTGTFNSIVPGPVPPPPFAFNIYEYPSGPLSDTFLLNIAFVIPGSLMSATGTFISDEAGTPTAIPGGITIYESSPQDNPLVIYFLPFGEADLAVSVLSDVDTVDTVVPEPASLLLLGTGLVGIGARLRRRRA